MRQHRARNYRAFTLIELIVVISIILILMALLTTAILRSKTYAKIGIANAELNGIQMALMSYKELLDEFPPDKAPSTIGGENLWYYLGRNIKNGERTHEALFPAREDRIYSSGGPYKEYVSVLGGRIHYELITDSNGKVIHFVLVDPGLDKKLGGKADANSLKGWTITSPDGNDDIPIKGPN
jgi:prepilin-type N-terminal cleavage/methylation domain-containing protein